MTTRRQPISCLKVTPCFWSCVWSTVWFSFPMKLYIFIADTISISMYIVCNAMLVQHFEPKGRRFTNFHYYYIRGMSSTTVLIFVHKYLFPNSLSVLVFASFFFCCLSLWLHLKKTPFVESTLVYFCFIVSSHWWVHFHITVLLYKAQPVSLICDFRN